MKQYNPLLDPNDDTLLREAGMPSTITISIKRETPKKKKSKEAASYNDTFAAMNQKGRKSKKRKKIRESEYATVKEIMEAWSDAARAAALEARRARGQGFAIRSAIARAAYKKAGGRSKDDRMTTIKTDGEYLRSDERPIDYGHVHQLLQEKYGKKRGNRTYEGLIDAPGKGVHFVVGTKIQLEKRAMLNALGMHGAKLDDHNYRTLHSAWMKIRKSISKKAPSKGPLKLAGRYIPSSRNDGYR